jgi:hypothetical protein
MPPATSLGLGRASVNKWNPWLAEDLGGSRTELQRVAGVRKFRGRPSPAKTVIPASRWTCGIHWWPFGSAATKCAVRDRSAEGFRVRPPGPGGVQHAGNGPLKAVRHTLLGVVRPVSILDQSHQRAHQSYVQVLPPERSQSQDLQDVFELSVLLNPLALPRGGRLAGSKAIVNHCNGKHFTAATTAAKHCR